MLLERIVPIRSRKLLIFYELDGTIKIKNMMGHGSTIDNRKRYRDLLGVKPRGQRSRYMERVRSFRFDGIA